MDNVKLIGDCGITPEFVVETMKSQVGKTKSVVAIVFNEDGEHTIHAACMRSELAVAALAIQEFYFETKKQ